MKRNVDLTAAGMFSRAPRRNLIAFTPRIWWMRINNEEGSEQRSNLNGYLTVANQAAEELIITGTRHRRHLMQLEADINSGDYCDCCGVSLMKKPWARQYGLCIACSNSLDDKVINRNTGVFMKTHMIQDRSKNPFRF